MKPISAMTHAILLAVPSITVVTPLVPCCIQSPTEDPENTSPPDPLIHRAREVSPPP